MATIALRYTVIEYNQLVKQIQCSLRSSFILVVEFHFCFVIAEEIDSYRVVLIVTLVPVVVEYIFTYAWLTVGLSINRTLAFKFFAILR